MLKKILEYRFRTRMMLGTPILVLTFFALDAHSYQNAQPIVVPIKDVSASGSPLQVSGSVSFLEIVTGNEVTHSRSEDISARNISDKPILLIVGSFEESGPKSGEWGFDLTVDRFLEKQPIGPGEKVTLLERPFGEEVTVESFKGSAMGEARPPKTEFRLQFVQFGDGSTFGDPSAAKESFSRRESAIAFLKKLRRTYDEGGDSALMQAVEQAPETGQPHALWIRIRERQQTGGAQGVLTYIDDTLSVVSKYEDGLHSNPASR